MFPVWVSDGKLRVIARMQVGRLITLAEYAREYLQLGSLPIGPVSPEFPVSIPSLATGLQLDALTKSRLHLREPNSTLSGALLPRICHSLGLARKPGKEKALSGLQDGLLVNSLSFQGHVRRASEQTRKILAAACVNS